MAIASVELGSVAFADRNSSSINGECIRQETLTVSGTAATLATALTTTEHRLDATVARIAVDTAAYVAIGTTPDATALEETDNTTARRYVPANTWIELPINVGEKVQVKAA